MKSNRTILRFIPEKGTSLEWGPHRVVAQHTPQVGSRGGQRNHPTGPATPRLNRMGVRADAI